MFSRSKTFSIELPSFNDNKYPEKIFIRSAEIISVVGPFLFGLLFSLLTKIYKKIKKYTFFFQYHLLFNN